MVRSWLKPVKRPDQEANRTLSEQCEYSLNSYARTPSADRQIVWPAKSLPITGRSWRLAAGFCTGSSAAKVVREHHEQLHDRRLVVHTKKRRDIETHVVPRTPGNRWPDNKTVVGRPAAFFIAEA